MGQTARITQVSSHYILHSPEMWPPIFQCHLNTRHMQSTLEVSLIEVAALCWHSSRQKVICNGMRIM